MHKHLVGFLVVSSGLLLCGSSTARPPWHEEEDIGPTLVAEFKQAEMVLVAKFKKAHQGKGEFEYEVIEVIKPHAFLKGKDVITIYSYLGDAHRVLIFADGDFWINHAVGSKEDGECLAYFKGAIALADAPATKRLEYAFRYLQSENWFSLDARREFLQADYKDYKNVAEKLPADSIVGWLRNPKTPPIRYGLYASLLGHAGLKEPSKYGQVLKDMIADPEKRKGSGIEGMLAGYAMLQPREALEYLKQTLSNPKEEFNLRYFGCLGTVRFLWEQRPDLVPEKQLLELMVMVARLPQMADFAIEDLRRWNRWEATPAILALFETPSHDTPLIKRSILRYALHAAAQKNEAAAKFVVRQDHAWVEKISRALEHDEDLKAPYQRAK